MRLSVNVIKSVNSLSARGLSRRNGGRTDHPTESMRCDRVRACGFPVGSDDGRGERCMGMSASPYQMVVDGCDVRGGLCIGVSGQRSSPSCGSASSGGNAANGVEQLGFVRNHRRRSAGEGQRGLDGRAPEAAWLAIHCRGYGMVCLQSDCQRATRPTSGTRLMARAATRRR